MELTRTAYFIDASYTTKDGKSYISLLLKSKTKIDTTNTDTTNTGTAKTVRLYYQFEPYFLVDAPVAKADEIKKVMAKRPDGSSAAVVRIESCQKRIGLLLKIMLKIFCAVPSDVQLLKAVIPFKAYEYGLFFPKRFIYDMQLTPFSKITYVREGRIIKKIIKIEPGPPELSVFAFDIETYNKRGMSDEKLDSIIMMSYATSNDKQGVITYKKAECAGVDVEVLADERKMLEYFFGLVKEINPDVLVGYNSSQFDLPYIRTRCELKGIKSENGIGRFGGKIKSISKGVIKGCAVEGRTHFDLYPLVKFFSFIGLIKTQSLSLDAVAHDVLGKNKVKIDKQNLWQNWDKGDLKLMCEYALMDAKLALELSGRFLPLEVEMSMIAKLPLFDTSISTSGQLVENLLLYNAVARNELIPSKPDGSTVLQREANPIQGAYVKLPEPGIYENIAVLDFRGLYPSIIISYNIDPNTLLPADSTKENVHKSPTGAQFVMQTKSPTKDQKTGTGQTMGLDLGLGLVPHVLDGLLSARGKLKDALKKLDKDSQEHVRISARSHALKILANSFYGYLGYARSRYYSRPCAESVTAWGRKHITEAMEAAEKAGFSVLYIDTDSLFIIYKKKEDVLAFMTSINKTLPEKMELELEGFFTRGVFVSKRTQGQGGSNTDDENKADTGAKKKYALLGEDGRMKIRGFELVRRDWSKIARQTQYAVLEAILKDGSKEKAAKIVRDTVTRLKGGNVPLEELVISTQLVRDLSSYAVKSPELSAAEKLKVAGLPVGKGTIIQFLIGKAGKTVSEKAVPFELAKEKEYDADYYVEHQILPSVMKIMKELGYDEHAFKVGGKQQSLNTFFE